MVDITREFQTRVLIARRSLERPRVDYPNDQYRRDIDNKEQRIFNGRDYVKTPENKFTLTLLGAVAEFERARLRKAKLPSCVRRFSTQLSQLRSEIIPALQEDSQTENVGSAKNGERHAS